MRSFAPGRREPAPRSCRRRRLMQPAPATVALLLAAALASAGCGRRHPPNLLLVTLDTTRADHLGCYGFGLARTPAIDRLAAEGVRCADAVTGAPITLPSHATIMTGLYPPAHGVRD
ncbi:MAG: sulfatase-like hydrolase/transferase, partial [Acidobacteria bacterium]|nr:sulfatase-like hydrolase/transferase [Acidobacteriota bacterium]